MRKNSVGATIEGLVVVGGIGYALRESYRNL